MSWRYGALLLAAVLVASCGVVGHPAQGTVHGTFERAGGPAIVKHGKATTPVMPLAGTVTFTNGNVSKVSIGVGSSGTFSARLPPSRDLRRVRGVGRPGVFGAADRAGAGRGDIPDLGSLPRRLT